MVSNSDLNRKMCLQDENLYIVVCEYTNRDGLPVRYSA